MMIGALGYLSYCIDAIVVYGLYNIVMDFLGQKPSMKAGFWMLCIGFLLGSIVGYLKMVNGGTP